MSGEYINADTIQDYWTQLKGIYHSRAVTWKDLADMEYQSMAHSEHDDSDNHFNRERLGKDTNVIDICQYKYLPDRNVAYHIQVLHKDGAKMDYYFQIKLKEEID